MPDPNVRTRSAFLPALLVLFVGSGCAALIYEVVWFQLLQLVIGSSAVSLGALLGTFMGGMCLGSLLLPRFVPPGRHPLVVYAVLELAIGAAGLLVLFALPPAGRVYGMSIGHGQSTVLVRGALCALFLGVPTFCMGATLPAIGRWVKATPSGVSWLGFFYGSNIAGAVAGSLLAGFYLLRVYDIAVATYVAVAINVAVALIAFILARCSPYAANAEEDGGPGTTQWSPPDDDAPSANWTIYLAIALSGLTALAAEVIWTRLLSLLLGGTVYTFSLILAVFLAGLGLGSSVGSLVGRGSEADLPHAARQRARVLLGTCQILMVGAIAWSAWLLNRSLPYWPIDPTLAARPADLLQLDLVRCVWALLPAAVLWGASFPLALAAVASPGSDAGRLVGRVYAANTVGAIVGALAFSLLLVGWIGTQQSQRILMALCTASALLALAPAVWQSVARTDRSPRSAAALGAAATALVALLIGASWWLARGVPEISSDLVAYGRFAASQASSDFVLYKGEGQNASVAVTMSDSGVRNFHVSGKIEASSEPQDMRLQRWDPLESTCRHASLSIL